SYGYDDCHTGGANPNGKVEDIAKQSSSPGEHRHRDHEHENGDAETKDRAECLAADVSKRVAGVVAVVSTPLGQRAQQPGREQQHDDDCRHAPPPVRGEILQDRKSTRLNSSHVSISYAVFCLKKKTRPTRHTRTVTRRSRS